MKPNVVTDDLHIKVIYCCFSFKDHHSSQITGLSHKISALLAASGLGGGVSLVVQINK